jgi:uncharacterized protein YdeI (YjbR/CyaY-like superfamily)
MKRYQTVDDFIAGHEKWQSGLKTLREILLDTELEEGLKWGAPIYTLYNKNVVGIGAFQSYMGLWFHQGAFLTDPAGKLLNAREGVTKGLRQWRFQASEEIRTDLVLIKSYILEAIANQKEGKEIKFERKKELVMPEEFQEAFRDDAELRAAFDQFTPGRQREFADYIAEAKREATRLRRLEKIRLMILQGIGLNDKYRK